MGFTRKILAGLGAGGAALLVLAGCTTPTSPDGGDGTGVIDLLTIRLSEPVAVLDSAVNSGNAAYQIRILSAGLLFRQDLTGEPRPELVESTEISSDELTQTMTLKEGLTYSDGTPLVAEDVVTMFRRAVIERPGGSAFFTPFVESVEATDDRTVVWHLLRPLRAAPDGAVDRRGGHPSDRST